MKKQLISLIVVSLFFVTTLGMLQYASFPSSASAPSSSISNSVYVNGTLSGYQSGSSTLSQQTLTIDGSYSDQLVQVSNSASSPTWSLIGSTQTAYTFNLGTVTFLSGQPVSLNSFIFAAPVDDNGEYDIGSGLTAVLSINGNTYTYTLPSSDYFISTTDPYFIINPSWTVDISGTYSVSMKITVTASYAIGAAASGGETTGSTSTGGTTSYPGGVPYVVLTYFYAYSSTSSNSYTPSLPSGTTSYSIAWTSQQSSSLNVNGNNVQGPSTSGNYPESSGNAYPEKLVSGTFNAAFSSYTGTVQVTANTTNAVTQPYNSGPLSQTITESGNWWNSTTSSVTIGLPSGWNSGATFSGNINHVLSSGYGTSTGFDNLFVSGSVNTNLGTPSSQYQDISVSGTVNASGLGISESSQELINYPPHVVSSGISLNLVNPGQSITYYVNLSEQISGELHQVTLNFGDSTPSEQSAITSSDSITFTHSYAKEGTYTPYAQVENFPNAPSGDNANLYYPSQSGSVNLPSISVQPISMSALPTDYQEIYKSASLSLKYSAIAPVSGAAISINGVQAQSYSGISQYSGTLTYAYSSPSEQPLYVVWSVTQEDGNTQSLTMQYGSPLIPAFNSTSVTVLQGTNETHTYPITISGNPAGNGTYQLNFNISGYAKYGINSAASNFLISYTNGTPVYTWIQSISGGNLSLWSKVLNGTTALQIEVMPQFENLFSANGYLGLANSSADNGVYVFEKYWSMYGGVMPSGLGGYLFDNGSYLPYSTVPQNFVFSDHQLLMQVNTSFDVYPQLLIPNQGSSLFSMLGSFSTPFLTNSTQAGGYSITYANNTADGIIGFTPGGSYYPYSGFAVRAGTTGNYQQLGYTFGKEALFSFGYAGSEIYGAIGASRGSVTGSASTESGHIHIGTGPGVSAPIRIDSLFLSSPGILNDMPTASISSTGSDYMANATTSSTFQGQPGGAYNSTWSYYNFQVPISPNTDYATVIWNSGWQLSNLYPQTYAPVLNGQNFATFSSLKGYTMIQVSLIMPSPQIGSPSTISVEPEQNNNSLYLQNLHLSMTYTPFGSSTQENLTAFGTLVSLPYGSTASFSLYNQWNQLMGADYGVLIDSTSATLPIAVSARTVTFNFENSTTNQVSIIANGITVSGFFGSATLATGYKYTWTTQVYDLYLGKNVNYSGIINDTQTNVNISTNAPPSSLMITVNAYAPSNQGEVGVPGTSPVNLFIDGSKQDVGSTFIGFVGSTYNITITDVLGQILYTKDLRLDATSVNLQADINVSSWQFSIQNQELVNSASPLATEHISLNLSGSTSTYYNFTNQVGSTATLYLKQGNYHLYLHDNATFNTTFNLSQNRNYVIFGQNLLTYAEWQKDFNQILNDTSGLQIQTVHSDSELQPGQAADYSFKAFFANGSQLTDAQLQQSSIVTQVTNASGIYPISLATQISGGIIYVNFSAPDAGEYTISSAVLYSSTIGGRVSYSLTVQPVVILSRGILLNGAGPSGSLSVNQTYNFTVTVDYGNYSAMNLKDTLSVYNNMTFTIYNGIDPVQQIKKLNYYAGVITFSALFNRTGIFSIYIQTHADLNGTDSGTTIIPVSVQGVSSSQLRPSLSVPADPTANFTAVVSESFQYLNGTYPGAAEMQAIFGNTTLGIQAGSGAVQYINPSSFSGFTVYFDVFEPAGNYILIAQTNLSGTLLAVGSIHFVPLSPGQIIMQFSGSQVQTNSSNAIILNMFFQSNGAIYSLSGPQTESVMHNLTVELELSGNFYGLLTPYYISPGMLGVSVNVSRPSAHYSLNASITDTNISGIEASGIGSAPFTAYPYNPSSPPYGITKNQIAKILSSPAAIAIGLIASVLGVLALVIPAIRKKHEDEVEDINQAALVVQGNLATKILEGAKLTEMEQAWWNAIPNETRKKLMTEGTAGRKSLFPKLSHNTPPKGRGRVNQ